MGTGNDPATAGVLAGFPGWTRASFSKRPLGGGWSTWGSRGREPTLFCADAVDSLRLRSVENLVSGASLKLQQPSCRLSIIPAWLTKLYPRRNGPEAFFG